MRGNVNNVIFLQKIMAREKDIAAGLNNNLQFIVNIQQPPVDISAGSPAFNLKITPGEAFTNDPFIVNVEDNDDVIYSFPVQCTLKLSGDTADGFQLSALNEPVTVHDKPGFVDFDCILIHPVGSQGTINKFRLTQDGTVRDYLEDLSTPYTFPSSSS